MSAPSGWFYIAYRREKVGPVSSTGLVALAKNGQLLPTDFVWKAPMKQWEQARQIRGLFQPLPATLAVPPPPQEIPLQFVSPAQPGKPSPFPRLPWSRPLRFLGLLLSAVVVEIRAIFGVLPLLRRRFWIAWGLCFLPAFIGLLPGVWAVFAQVLVLIGLGLGGLFSGTLAKLVRRRKWVEFPDGPEVAPYLPQLITLLMAPPYFLAMLVLFHQAAVASPGILPSADYWDALLLALDNFVRTKVFFDVAACFHLRFGSPVENPAGRALVFVSRFLLDLVFIKLAFQLLNAAWFRAQGLGRGQDLLYAIKQEIAAADVPRVKELCQEVGDSLRDAVDTLRRYHEEGGDKSATAWLCLVTMKDYAIPYLTTRHRAATGDERERIAKLIQRLENAPAEPEQALTRPWLLFALALVLALGLAALFLLTSPAGFAVAVLMMLLTSWMLAGSRGWIDRLVRCHVLAPSTPNRLAWLQLRWALCLFPLLIVDWARFFQLAGDVVPTIFSGAAPGELNFPSTLKFTLDNLLHLQVFVDVFKIYGVHIADLRQEAFLGGLVTFLLRLVLNVGVIELVVSFGMVWFNRVFRKFAVSPNAELALRQEAFECGPQAALLVGYHLREVREFLVERMSQQWQQKDEGMLVALAASGFFKDVQAQLDGLEQTEALANTRMSLGVALKNQGWLDEAVAEFQAALEIYERLVCEGRNELLSHLALTWMNLGIAMWKQGRLDAAITKLQAARENFERLVQEGREDLRNELAETRSNLGNALRDQGRLEEAIVEHQAARESRDQLVREGRVELRSDLALTQMNLGFSLWKQCRLDEAIAEYQGARDSFARLVREGRDDLRHDLGMTLINLGNALDQQGREEAITEYQAAGEIYEWMVGEGRDDLRSYLAIARMNLGNALQQRGRLPEAVSEYNAARESYERLVRDGRDDLRDTLAMTRMNLGYALQQQGRLEEGIAELQFACESYERLLREGQFEDATDLAKCWYKALGAATKISQQRALSVNRSAFALLHELLLQRGKLAPAALTEIGKFLRLAQESNVCADEAAALAAQFAPTTSAARRGD
jgi:tetratricopeptide (TPR) repeat protein